jgi:hypothetical protein
MSHAEIIVALGGTVAVAKAVGVSGQVVTNWKTRGISWRYRGAVAKLAATRGVVLPGDFLGDV